MVGALAVHGDSAPAAKRCASVASDEARNGRVTVRVDKGRVSCRTARRVARKLFNGEYSRSGSGATPDRTGPVREGSRALARIEPVRARRRTLRRVRTRCAWVCLSLSSVFAVGVATIATPSESAARTARNCGAVFVSSFGGWAWGNVRATGVTCRRARSVARYAFTHSVGNAPRGPNGWRCTRGSAVDRLEFACDQARRPEARVAVYELDTARWRRCGDVSFEAQTDHGAFDIRARRVRCTTARSVARRSEGVGPAGRARTFSYRAQGFRCLGREQVPSVYWRCVRGQRALSFTG
jgi:hypothetical protein